MKLSHFMKSKKVMWIFIFILLIQSASNVKEDCNATVYMKPRYEQLNICSGDSFNLTWNFLCLGNILGIKVLKNKRLSPEEEIVHLAITSPASMHNVKLTLHVNSATEMNSGLYNCKSDPPYVISHGTDVTVRVSPVQTSIKPLPHELPSSWISKKILIWYLLCKTGVFLIGFVVAVLKITCQVL